jgi:hypothetical protein
MSNEKRTFTVGELVSYDTGGAWHRHLRYTRVERITEGGTVFVRGPYEGAKPLQFRKANDYRGLHKVTDHERAVMAWQKKWGALSLVSRRSDGTLEVEPFKANDIDAVRAELETAAELLRTEPKEASEMDE